jgi:hypothetical protein
MKRPHTIDATRVSFRLQPEIAAELAHRASQAGTSHNLLAKDMVIAAMTRPDDQRCEIEMLSQELHSLRSALAVVSERRQLESESLSSGLAKVSKTLAAVGDQRRELEALRLEISEARKALLERDKEWHNLLGTLWREYSELQGSPSESC